MLSGDTKFIGPDDLDQAIKAAAPGAVIVYARGNVARDRVERSFVRHQHWRELQQTAALAYGWHLAGKVCLTQRRVDVGDYEYLATVREPA